MGACKHAPRESTQRACNRTSLLLSPAERCRLGYLALRSSSSAATFASGPLAFSTAALAGFASAYAFFCASWVAFLAALSCLAPWPSLLFASSSCLPLTPDLRCASVIGLRPRHSLTHGALCLGLALRHARRVRRDFLRRQRLLHRGILHLLCAVLGFLRLLELLLGLLARAVSATSCVKSAVKSAVNSYTLHHLPRAYATHWRYVMEILPINI